jgi:hypothetical protein
MTVLLRKLSNNNNNENPSPLITEQPEQQVPIPSHSYPFVVLLLWGIVLVAFVINFLISCIWYAPLHLQAASKICTIDKLVENKEYFEALELHKELCSTYPQSYVNSYAVKIAAVCFECSQHNQSLFKEGVCYLKGKSLNETEYSELSQKIPLQLKETYRNLFDVLCREKNQEKEYLFILNDEKVKLL